jgi:hypothetical protein
MASFKGLEDTVQKAYKSRVGPIVINALSGIAVTTAVLGGANIGERFQSPHIGAGMGFATSVAVCYGTYRAINKRYNPDNIPFDRFYFMYAIVSGYATVITSYLADLF